MEGLLADASDDNLDESPVNRVSDIVSGLVYQHEKCRENVPFSENISTYEMPHEQSSESSDANLHVRPSTSGKAVKQKIRPVLEERTKLVLIALTLIWKSLY